MSNWILNTKEKWFQEHNLFKKKKTHLFEKPINIHHIKQTLSLDLDR